ncbi:MAG: DUF58 domain-containing protein [Anaerolineae bacterium]|jgi:uncharacterized protein (DUF58 family)
MRRLVVVGILLYTLVFLGLANREGRLLALAVPLVVYLGASLLYGPEKPQLQVTRSFSSESAALGRPVVVRLEVVNEGPDLEQVLIEDLIPSSIEVVEGQSSVLTALPSSGTVELEYTLLGKRGSHEFQNVRATACDHLGLFQHQVTYPTSERLVIMPDILKLRHLAIRPLRTRAYAGPVPARQGGSGVSFFGVRTYEPGDPLRWINWRMSARHPSDYYVNEFEPERIADVGLILDIRQRNDVQVRGKPLLEYSVSAMSSLASAFLDDGNRVGMLIYGRYLNWTFPGYGKIQRKRILEALTRVKPGNSLVFDQLDLLPTRYFPAKSQIVLVSPLSPDDTSMLIRLRAQGYQVLVISPDPVSYEAGALGDRKDAELAARIARLERELQLRYLRRAGVQVVDWQVDQPFDRVIHATLARTPQWHRAIGTVL